MVALGFHASHEQIGPRQLLENVQMAERAGFDAAMCSDHIEPWSASQGHSGFACSWLGAALATISFASAWSQPRAPRKTEEMLAAYREAGGRGTAALQVHLSWAQREEDAVAIALDQWHSNVFSPPVIWDLPTAAHFDGMSADVGEDQIRKVVNVSADPGRHAAWLKEPDRTFDRAILLDLLDRENVPLADDGGFELQLDRYDHRWFRIQHPEDHRIL